MGKLCGWICVVLLHFTTWIPAQSAEFSVGYLASSRLDPSIQLARDIAREITEPHIEVKAVYQEYNNSFDDILWAGAIRLSAFESLTNSNISAIIGPFHELYAVIAESLGLPYLTTTLVPENSQPAPTVQIYPDAETFESAVADTVVYYKWPGVAVMYDSEEGRDVIERLLRRQTVDVKGYKVNSADIAANETVLKQTLIEMKDQRILEVVLVCSPSAAHGILQQALYLGMLSSRNKWIIVNMGTEETDLTDYVDSNANMTALSINRDEEYNSRFCYMGFKQSILHDAFHVFAAMARNYKQKGQGMSGVPPKGILYNSLKYKIEVHGCTGSLDMTGNGKRRNQFLQIYTLQGLGAGTKGTWTSGEETVDLRIDFRRRYKDLLGKVNSEFGNSLINIVTKIEPPFVQWKKGHGNSQSTKYLEGYCLDILHELVRRYGFKYKLYLVPDGKFGSWKNETYGWTGMIREIINQRADIAVAPFGITPNRSKVADFTKPFMIKGTATIVKKPERHISNFQFLAPLSKVVWIGIFISFLAASLVLFAISRINSDRRPKLKDNLMESFWYIWAALLRGGTSCVPNATSSRTLSSAWWFFSLIVVAIYTANLAAFLTLTNVNLPINSAADLASQKIFDYGTVEGSQIETFFKHSRISAYEKMYAHMSVLSPGSMVRRVENGLERVRKEKYAFLWDSPTLRYMIQSECDLLEIGAPFDLKGYGWAVRKNAPFYDKLSWGMLKLSDEGILQKLEKRWWGRSGCPDTQQTASTEALEFKNVAGIFLVLAMGVLLALLLSAFQYAMYKRRETLKNRSKTTDENTWPLKQERGTDAWQADMHNSYTRSNQFR